MTVSGNKQIKISIVIAAWNGITHLLECLNSLDDQTLCDDVEVIVVSNFETGISESETQFPAFRHLFLSAESTVPQLRAYGIAQAHGEIVAVSEDFCVFEANWCEEIKKAHRQKYAVVGGAVENSAVENALDWAVYFYDYGKYMPPQTAGTANTLSGANVSYKREILESIRESYRDEFFETSIHEGLKHCGEELFFLPSAIIFHNKNYSWEKVVRQFYYQARTFAAMRVSGASFPKRLLLMCFSLLLPIVLTLRVAERTINHKKYLKELIWAMPWLMILMCVWSWGEFCGYLVGEGNSRREWK